MTTVVILFVVLAVVLSAMGAPRRGRGRSFFGNGPSSGYYDGGSYGDSGGSDGGDCGGGFDGGGGSDGGGCD